MKRVILSRRAQADLKDIGRFIGQHNPVAAKRWVGKLRAICKETIGMFPRCGTQYDQYLPGMRGFSVGNYFIFFRGQGPVEILRVVNGTMDFDRLNFVD